MKVKKLIFTLLAAIVISSCSPSPVQIQQAIAQTETAAPPPTQTPYPTQTPFPPATFTPTTISKYSLLSWADLENLILDDHTNWHSWTEEYNCVNFSMDLVKNVRLKNNEAWIVAVTFLDQPEGHAFVAFPTTDRGIIWIEPQSDEAYMVSNEGELLCLANNPLDCWEGGIVTEIIEPASCDPFTHKCW